MTDSASPATIPEPPVREPAGAPVERPAADLPAAPMPASAAPAGEAPALTPDLLPAPPDGATSDLASGTKADAKAGETAGGEPRSPAARNDRRRDRRRGGARGEEGGPRPAGGPKPEQRAPRPANGPGRDPARGASRPERAERPGARPPRPEQRPQRHHPVLDQLAELYPLLFGATVVPLKRGVYHDLLESLPPGFDKEGLKLALGLHTRSTRYLTAVAAGQNRHDLSGRPVEPMAPEHVYQALVEVFRRRQSRGGEDLRAKLVRRIVQAFDASAMTREAYAEQMRGRDEAANAALDAAMAEVAVRNARDEAMLRAFEASGQDAAAFADMYGLPPVQVVASLERARRAQTPEA